MSSCPLCSPPAQRIFFQGKLVIGLWAEQPVTSGHAVLVTRRHVTDWFAASPAEQQELMGSLAAVRDAILERQLPDGFNIGIHIGAAAGQDVPHLHVDMIPRYRQALPEEAGDSVEPATTVGSTAGAGAGEGAEEARAPAGSPQGAPQRQPRKLTDAWNGKASLAEPVLDRVERELKAEAQQQAAKVTQLPGTTRSAPEAEPTPASPREKSASRPGLSAVPAAAEAPSPEEPEASVEPEEPEDEPDSSSSAYDRAPSYRSLDDGYDPTYDDDDLYDDEGETRLPGRSKAWVVLLVLLLLGGGGGYAIYWAKTSPYIGDPPAHLKVDPQQPKPTPAAAVADAGTKRDELPAAPRGRRALAPPRLIPGTTTPAAGTPVAPAGTPSAASEYDTLMAQASALLKQRKRRAAYKLLDKALEVQPSGWQALQHLAWRDAKRGRLGRALKRARAALKANKDAPYANLVRGVAMHERGRKAAARAGYSRFLRHCKGCPEAGEIRRVLRTLGDED